MKYVTVTLTDGNTIEGEVVSDFGDTTVDSHDSEMLIDSEKGLWSIEVWVED